MPPLVHSLAFSASRATTPLSWKQRTHTYIPFLSFFFFFFLSFFFGPVLLVHITSCLDISGIEIQILSTMGNSSKSWVVTSRGNTRNVEGLRLNDPDHNPRSSELVSRVVVDRVIAVKKGTLSRKNGDIMDHCGNSCVPSENSVEYGERSFWSGMTFLPAGKSKETHLKPPSRNWPWSWCATIFMKHFIGQRWTKSLRHAFRREADATSLIPIGFSISTKEATIPGTNIAKTLKASYWEFALFKDTLVDTWSRLIYWFMSLFIQMERILVSPRIIFRCHFNLHLRICRWRKRKKRGTTIFLLHFSQLRWGDNPDEEGLSKFLLRSRKYIIYSKWKLHQDADYLINLAKAQERDCSFGRRGLTP